MFAPRPLRCTLAAGLAAFLCACGGGSDTADTTATQAPLAPLEPLVADTTCGLANFREDALRLVNARRAKGADCGDHGSFAPAGPLAWNDRLTLSAYGHSADMAAHDYFSHTSLDGRSFVVRIDASGYRWSVVAENLAAGPLDVAGAVDGWMASPGHCANLMDGRLRDMGLACAANADSTYGRYFTLDLGAPR